MTIFLSILSGISFAGAGLGYKMAEHRQCRAPVFILVFAITRGAFAGIKALFGVTAWLDPRLWLLGIFFAQGLFLLLGAMSLPSTIVFPLSASIALLGGVFLTSIVYGEKLNPMKITGVMVGLTALLLAVLR